MARGGGAGVALGDLFSVVWCLGGDEVNLDGKVAVKLLSKRNRSGMVEALDVSRTWHMERALSE